MPREGLFVGARRERGSGKGEEDSEQGESGGTEDELTGQGKDEVEGVFGEGRGGEAPAETAERGGSKPLLVAAGAELCESTGFAPKALDDELCVGVWVGCVDEGIRLRHTTRIYPSLSSSFFFWW